MDLSGHSPTVVDKIHRLFDILEQISNVKFLSDRLSFYGGTALNFIHFSEVPRLSVDLDFNYRHIDGEKDWGDVRSEIDDLLLRILKDLGYQNEKIKVQAQYPLGRIDIKYDTSSGSLDNVKLEIGYMRRMPVLKNDVIYQIENPRLGSKFNVKSPQKEELWANKFCTMISRNKTQLNARDVFDVYSISKSDFDFELFLDIIMVEGLMMQLDFSDPHISLNTNSLVNIRDLVIGDINLKSICDEVNSFIGGIYENFVTERWSGFRDEFKEKREINSEYFKNPDMINDNLNEHPQLKWVIKKTSQE
jgi:predicted nucleotidyltransferase component of viral defense system